MAGYENFYTGSAYPFEKPYAGFTGPNAYHQSVKDISFPTNALTANQLKKVSDLISTGTRNIEVSGLNIRGGGGPMKLLATIPRQHWKEIDRLRKLTGVDLTFHGPLVEPTGAGGRGNWTEDQRKEAETQMKASVELAQQMNSDSSEKNPKGVVMTFHSSVSIPEVKRRIKTADGKEEIVLFSVVNERTGEMGPISLPPEYFEGTGKKFATKEDVSKWLENKNEERWTNQISNLSIETNRSREGIAAAFRSLEVEDRVDNKKTLAQTKQIQNFGMGGYDEYIKDPNKMENELIEQTKTNPTLKDLDPDQAIKILRNTINNFNYAETNAQQAYFGFKEAFNEAYQKAKISDAPEDRETVKRLEKIKEQLSPVVSAFKEDKTKFPDFQNELIKSVQELRSIKAPAFYRPLEDFAIDKASETFSNVALYAYTNAKETGRAPGIISIENPPAGMSGLTRADEIKDLIEATRKKFTDKAVEQGIMSRSEAEEKSKQIIGATWDVGHINSIRKWGYGKKDVIQEAKTIAPFVKHMHLADNLGFEDAELPISMGNVPIDEILALDENFRKAKKAIETGDWFQSGLGMSHTPIRESFSGLSAPVYSMGEAQKSAYWNQAASTYGGYSTGLGPINPEVHQSIYGAGFGNLPAYLGGEIPGRGNSSFSGTPME